MASTSETGSKRQGKPSAAARSQDGTAPKSKKKPRDRGHNQETVASREENTPPATPSKTPKSHTSSTPTPDGHAGKSQAKSKKKGNVPPSADANPPPPVTAATPAKPVQVYAGPTFHASPAPSALPIPKLFSKSMPQVNDKDASLQSMLRSEQSEESSEAEGSPILRNSTVRTNEPVIREESPLDILFRADKEEKARRQLNSSQSSLATPPSTRRAQSNSPGPGSSGHGRPRPSEASMFPLDLDSHPTSRTPSSRLEDSPSIQSNLQAVRSAEAKAKTEALKNLLRFQGGPSQRPVSATDSLASSRSSSMPPTAQPAIERSASDNYLPTESFPKRPYPQPGHASPRANPHQMSQLRQQLDQVANEHYTSSASSPRAWAADDPRGLSQHQPTPPASAPSTSHRASPGPAFTTRDSSMANVGDNPTVSSQESNNNTQVMEDQLRRILKLDSLSSAGVQS